jgi:hypothetical protein
MILRRPFIQMAFPSLNGTLTPSRLSIGFQSIPSPQSPVPNSPYSIPRLSIESDKGKIHITFQMLQTGKSVDTCLTCAKVRGPIFLSSSASMRLSWRRNVRFIHSAQV